ncbi:MAG: hypothetical protein ACRD3F_07210, partial [Acidobacteriaceae bacterium]
MKFGFSNVFRACGAALLLVSVSAMAVAQTTPTQPATAAQSKASQSTSQDQQPEVQADNKSGDQNYTIQQQVNEVD